MRRLVSFNAFLPLEEIEIPGMPAVPRPPMKTIYLLHGYSGTCSDWGYGARVQELAARYNYAVIMPSGENSFYLDDVEKGELFGEYVGCELVEFTRRLFGLSSRREDTFIGGYSMGGYGALRTGLKYHGTFGGIAALSSALIIKSISKMKPGDSTPIANYDYYHRVFGDLGALVGSDKDPEALARRIAADKASMPRLYMACGTEDFLIAENRDLHEGLRREGIEHRYVEGPGVHDFKFWDDHIEKALVWLREDHGEASRKR
jgi:putative tributyrin esterase